MKMHVVDCGFGTFLALAQYTRNVESVKKLHNAAACMLTLSSFWFLTPSFAASFS